MRIGYENGVIDDQLVASASITLSSPPSNMIIDGMDTKYKSLASGDLLISMREKTTSDGYDLPASITQDYTNIITSGADLTAVNWTGGNLTKTLTELSVEGNLLTKLEVTGSTGQVSDIANGLVSAGVSIVGSLALRNGDLAGSEKTWIILAGASTVIDIELEWSTKLFTETTGSVLHANWIDDDTVELFLTGVTGNTDLQYLIQPNLSDRVGSYIYVTACQTVDNTTTMFPFVDGSKTADIINQTFEMPNKFTRRIRFTPNYAYNTADPDRMVYSWLVSATQKQQVYYEESDDTFTLVWQDGGTVRTMKSQVFDDGSSFVDINQPLDMIISLNLTSGGVNDSRFIIIPQTGAISEDTSFSGAPDVRTTTFPSTSVGSLSGVQHIDSLYEFDRVYQGLLVGAVSSSSDVDLIVQSQTLLLEAVPPSVLPIRASMCVLNAHNMIAGDTATLKGYDTYVSDTESVAYTFTFQEYGMAVIFDEVSYFWEIELNVASPVEIGGLFLGTHLITPAYEIGAKTIHKTTDDNTISKSGQLNGDEGYDYRVASYLFPWITEAEKALWLTFWRAVGTRKQFYLLQYPDRQDIQPVFYCFFTSSEFKLEEHEGNRSVYKDVPISIREVF